MVISAGWSVIVDATFLNRARRDRFVDLARELRVPFLILDFQAAPDLLRARVQARSLRDKDASDAGVKVLERQMTHHDLLAPEETVLSIDEEHASDADAVRRRLFE